MCLGGRVEPPLGLEHWGQHSTGKNPGLVIPLQVPRRDQFPYGVPINEMPTQEPALVVLQQGLIIREHVLNDGLLVQGQAGEQPADPPQIRVVRVPVCGVVDVDDGRLAVVAVVQVPHTGFIHDVPALRLIPLPECPNSTIGQSRLQDSALGVLGQLGLDRAVLEKIILKTRHEILTLERGGLMPHRLGGTLQRLLELVLELLLPLFLVRRELAPLGTDSLQAILHLPVGVQPPDVLGSDIEGLEIGVHVRGIDVKHGVRAALALQGVLQDTHQVGVLGGLLLVDPGLADVLERGGVPADRDVLGLPARDPEVAFLGRIIIAHPLVGVVDEPHHESHLAGLFVPGLQVLLDLRLKLLYALTEFLNPFRFLPVPVLDLSLGVLVHRHGARAIGLGHLFLLLELGRHPVNHELLDAVSQRANRNRSRSVMTLGHGLCDRLGEQKRQGRIRNVELPSATVSLDDEVVGLQVTGGDLDGHLVVVPENDAVESCQVVALQLPERLVGQGLTEVLLGVCRSVDRGELADLVCLFHPLDELELVDVPHGLAILHVDKQHPPGIVNAFHPHRLLVDGHGQDFTHIRETPRAPRTHRVVVVPPCLLHLDGHLLPPQAVPQLVNQVLGGALLVNAPDGRAQVDHVLVLHVPGGPPFPADLPDQIQVTVSHLTQPRDPRVAQGPDSHVDDLLRLLDALVPRHHGVVSGERTHVEDAGLLGSLTPPKSLLQHPKEPLALLEPGDDAAPRRLADAVALDEQSDGHLDGLGLLLGDSQTVDDDAPPEAPCLVEDAPVRPQLGSVPEPTSLVVRHLLGELGEEPWVLLADVGLGEAVGRSLPGTRQAHDSRTVGEGVRHVVLDQVGVRHPDHGGEPPETVSIAIDRPCHSRVQGEDEPPFIPELLRRDQGDAQGGSVPCRWRLVGDHEPEAAPAKFPNRVHLGAKGAQSGPTLLLLSLVLLGLGLVVPHLEELRLLLGALSPLVFLRPLADDDRGVALVGLPEPLDAAGAVLVLSEEYRISDLQPESLGRMCGPRSHTLDLDLSGVENRHFGRSIHNAPAVEHDCVVTLLAGGLGLIPACRHQHVVHLHDDRVDLGPVHAGVEAHLIQLIVDPLGQARLLAEDVGVVPTQRLDLAAKDVCSDVLNGVQVRLEPILGERLRPSHSRTLLQVPGSVPLLDEQLQEDARHRVHPLEVLDDAGWEPDVSVGLRILPGHPKGRGEEDAFPVELLDKFIP